MADVFRTIIVAVSGTESSLAAASLALRLAKLHGAQVVMVGVVDEGQAQEIARVMGRTEAQVLAELEKSARGNLRHVELMARQEGVEVETVLRRGAPHLEIVGEADDRRADLIVVGSTHVVGPRVMAIGRVVERVLEHSASPVLVVRHTA